MAGWTVKTIGEAIEKTETVNPTHQPEKRFIYIDVSSVSNETFKITQTSEILGADAPSRARRQIRTNDVIFATIRPTLKRIAFVTEEYDNQVCSTGYIVLRAKPEVLPQYLFYYLFSADFLQAMETLQAGASYPAVTDVQVKQQPFPIPPLDEQKRIVAILDDAFEGLNRARENTQANLNDARELFVSFLADEFQTLTSSYPLQPIGDVADYCLGKMLDKNKNQGSPRRYLRNLNVRWFSVDTSDVLEMRIEEREKERYSVLRGDLLICEGGYPGRAAIWESDDPIFFQKALHRVRFANPFHNQLLMYYLFLMDASGKLREYFSGAGIQHFTGQALSRFRLPMPPADVINVSVGRMSEMRLTVRTLETRYEKNLQMLDTLRQSLLQKAFSGELT